METQRKIKNVQWALKVYVFACGVGLTVYAGLLCAGLRSPLAEWLSLTAAFGLLTIGAWAFRLCWVTYAFIAYMYAIRCAMILQTVGFWGKWLDVAHWVAFIVGLFLCGLFVGRCVMSNCGENERGGGR